MGLAKTIRVLSVFSVVATLMTVGMSAASAHTGEFLHAFEHWSGPPQWIPTLGLVLSGTALIWSINSAALIWAKRNLSLRSVLVPVTGLSAWLVLGFLQDLLPASRSLLTAGYFVFPIALVTVWIFILARWRDVADHLRNDRLTRVAGVATAVAFVIVMAWSSNLVAPPEPEETPSHSTSAFIVIYRTYGPLAVWPNVEFWIPSVPLVGVVSVGTGLLLLTLGAASGVAVASTVHSYRHLQGQRTNGSVLGAMASTAVGANFCCCCAPAFYPALSVLIGSTAAGAVAVWFIGSSSPFYDILPVATIGALLWGLSRTLRNYNDSECSTQNTDDHHHEEKDARPDPERNTVHAFNAGPN